MNSKIRQYIEEKSGDLYFWKKLILGFSFLFLLHCWTSGMMLLHVWDSPFVYKGADPTYWLMEKSGIAALLTGHSTIAFLFSLLLLLSPVLAFVLIKKTWPMILTGILFLLYQVLLNYKIGYHAHHLFGFQFAFFPFYFGQRLFPLALGLSRILCCLTYFFAGFFKLYGGAWKSSTSFAHVLENQHAAYFHFYPDDWRTSLAQFFIAHPLLGQFLFIGAMLLQLSFFVGLFSNKYNRFLALFILMFHLMDWWLMNLGVFMGMCVMMCLLLFKSDALSIQAKS